MTAREAYELTTGGGASDFVKVIGICEALGPYCLIGGLAVNCYVEPVYTLDADLVLASACMAALEVELRNAGFSTALQAHFLNATFPGSELRAQFATDPRYQPFVGRSECQDVLGVKVRVATLRDLVQGKIWEYEDPRRRPSKRKKDELDLIRIAEAYPELRPVMPSAVQEFLR